VQHLVNEGKRGVFLAQLRAARHLGRADPHDAAARNRKRDRSLLATRVSRAIDEQNQLEIGLRIDAKCADSLDQQTTLSIFEISDEVYLRLVDIRRVQWQDRAHFFAVAARLMRRILVDFARAHKNQKRGGALQRVTLDEDMPVSGNTPEDLIDIDHALQSLAAQYERKAQVVELRFFGGLSVEETAEVLNISPETVMRDWKFAKTWLLRELSRTKSEARDA
jgi:RNA polymerase sigma factor (TIGR02999 family)